MVAMKPAVAFLVGVVAAATAVPGIPDVGTKYAINIAKSGLPGVKYWQDIVKEKGYARAWKEGAPKYRPPEDWVYNTKGGPVEGKINVHLIPHTHDDTGWQVTVDQYFFGQVYYVLDTVVPRLFEDENRRFIYVEIAFFARWWDQQPERIKNMTKLIVQRGQLEFINGGWCMHDEASPYYTAMVDQTTRGHMFLKKNFGPDAIPKGTWQIDPFGHSNTEAWLIGAEAGMQSLFWGRTDFQDLDYRKAAKNHSDDRWPEWIWQGSASLGESARVFAGELGGGGYGPPIPGFENPGNGIMAQLQDDPRRHDYNMDAWMDVLVDAARNQAEFTKTSHQMWAMGSDFQYQNADHWYHNMDKIIHYGKVNGSVNFFYSTPTRYVKAKFNETVKKDLKWEVRTDDIFPLGDNFHNYWSGYFTSRPALKKQVRFATNFLDAARKLEVLAKPGPIGVVTERPSPVVGSSFTDSLEGTIGVATHHDGMSGTERQDVADDYSQRISESQIEAEAGVSASLEKLLGGKNITVEHCNCNKNVGAIAGDCLNISMCIHTQQKDRFQVVAWNSRGHVHKELLRIPVTGDDFKVTDVSMGSPVESQLIPLSGRDYELPLLYLRYRDLNNMTLVDQSSNKATHLLVFMAEIPALGYNTYEVTRTTNTLEMAAVSQPRPLKKGEVSKYSSGTYEIEVDEATGMVASIKNLVSNITSPFSIDWGFYNSSVGGCTEGVAKGVPACSGQASGAYMFRPNSSTFFFPGEKQAPAVVVMEGPLVTEIRQTFSDWATHVIRLIRGAEYVEVEWTAGPIPLNQPWMGTPDKEYWGKEVVVKYSASAVESESTFYTDSNGREMLKRMRNARGPSYPPLNVSEPIAGNYYPVNAMIAIKDAKTQLAVISDVTQGGSSMASGEIELMVHRRVQHDDARGVQEPLNETMCGCNDVGAAPGQMGEHGQEGDGGCDCAGLTMRGKHLVIFDTEERTNVNRRFVNEALQSSATIAIQTGAGTPTRPKFSALGEALPANVKLMTLTSNYESLFEGGVMLRFAHLFSVDETLEYSKIVNVSLAKIFSSADMKIESVEEMSLTGNMELATMDKEKLNWPSHPTDEGAWHTSQSAVTTRRFMDPADPTFTIQLRPMELRTLIVKFAKPTN